MENKTKTIFVALIAAALVPLTIMGISDATSDDPTIPDKVPDRVIQIQKPVETQVEINDMKTVENLFQESTTLTDSLETITEQHKNSTIPQDAQDKMDKINKRLTEIEVEFGVLQTEARKLYALTAEDEKQLLDAKKIIWDTDIPITGIGIDSKVGAVSIGFESQAIADTHIPRIEQLIDVPYYVEIYDLPVFDACARQTSDCDPLMGGVKITTEYNSTTINKCTYSIPAVRNLPFWQTETGFVTAGHCFSSQNGNDVRQPNHTDSKIWDLTKRVVGGECDCAFVKKVGSESTLFGTWNGVNKSNQLLSKSDPLKGDYVVLVGAKSGMNIAQVKDTSFGVPSTPRIQNTIKVNYDTSKGDSGGSVIDFTTRNVYHGLISSSGNGHAHVIPWSHINAGLDLR